MKKLVWCVVAACGGGGGGSSPDAAPVTGPISVRAAAGTHVLFRGPDGVVQDVVAGDSGFATAMSAANTAATVIGAPTLLSGYEGLNPGDTVDIEAPTDEPAPLMPKPMVIVPRYQNAVNYSFQGSSGALGGTQDSTTSPTIATSINAKDTPHKTDATLVATTKASSGDAYSIVEHADLTGGPVTFPAFQPTPIVSVAASGFPLPVRDSGVGIVRYDSSDPSSPLASQNLTAATGGYQGTLVPVGDRVTISGSFEFDSDREVDYYAPDSDLVVDGSQMPHLGISAAWDGTKAAWMESAEGVDPLLSYIAFNANGAQIFVVAPYTGPSLELPPLPATIDTSAIFVTIAATMGFAPGTSYIDAIPQSYIPRWKVRILQ